jgi:hypothetical protein
VALLNVATDDAPPACRRRPRTLAGLLALR